MNAWRPDWTVHPGEILREALQVRDMTQLALADLIKRPVQVVNEVINGKKAITADTALDLERALGISAEFWVHAQAEYCLGVARQRRRQSSEASQE